MQLSMCMPLFTRASSNHVPFLKVAKAKSWSASLTGKDELKGSDGRQPKKTRILIKIPEGNGMAFAVPEGHSPISP